MPTKEKRSELRARQTTEVEASQAGLRKSIAETERLRDQSDKMLRRHRQECEDGETAAEPPSDPRS